MIIPWNRGLRHKAKRDELILLLFETGFYSKAALARHFGVQPQWISFILKRKTARKNLPF